MFALHVSQPYQLLPLVCPFKDEISSLWYLPALRFQCFLCHTTAKTVVVLTGNMSEYGFAATL